MGGKNSLEHTRIAARQIPPAPAVISNIFKIYLPHVTLRIFYERTTNAEERVCGNKQRFSRYQEYAPLMSS